MNSSLCGLVATFVTIILFVFSAFRALNPKQDLVSSRYLIQSKVFKMPNVQCRPNKKNPPKPESKSKINNEDQLYIMILDTEFKPNSYQCIMKKQWVDKVSELDFVDSIEMYSLNGYKNEECNLSTLTVDPPTNERANNSPYLLHQSLQQYLKRSKSGWIFIINDAAYLNIPHFAIFFNNFSKSNPSPYENSYLTGGCFEKRSYFQEMSLNSGVIVSRKFVKEILSKQTINTWEVSIDIDIEADEAFSHASDQIGMPIKQYNNPLFVGQPFWNSEHFNFLKKKRFSELKTCNLDWSIHTQYWAKAERVRERL